MKKIRARTICLFLSSFILLFGCAENKNGKYMNIENSSEYIELYRNNSFILIESGLTVRGLYEIEGKELKLKFDVGNQAYTVKASIEGSMITDEQNKKWHKYNFINPLYVAFFAALLTMMVVFYSYRLSKKYLQALVQIGGVFIGVAVMVPFTESAMQAREVHGKYYFYTLIIFVVIYKVVKYFKLNKTNHSLDSE